MGGDSVLGALFKSVGFYSKSFSFFLVLAVIGFGALYFRPLQADEVVTNSSATSETDYDIVVRMIEDGSFYIGNEKLDVETVPGEQSYRFRYQVIDRPKQDLETLSLAVLLPKPLPEASIGHRFISNGGAAFAESSLVEPQTLVFKASGIGTQAQLTFEIEVPKSYVATTALRVLQNRLLNLPPIVWTSISIALPLLTALMLLLVGLSRSRKIPTKHLGTIEDPPSRLAPALLGILIRGKLGSREIAATLLDLARRGHLVIHHVSNNDFRFSRRPSPDRLEDFETVMLDQIFGPVSDRANSEEISFALAQELFSRRLSEAFILAYQKINNLGYFYTNPLTLHRRYQFAAIVLFLLGLVGFFANLVVFSHLPLFLLFWAGMLISALLIYTFSRNLPARTVYGDRELAKWLVFGNYLTRADPINFAAHNQEKYLAYLPYAVVMESEVEWTRRYYELPFTQPTWYICARITTIDEFANKIFPLFGYLSHTLALSAQPSAR